MLINFNPSMYKSDYINYKMRDELIYFLPSFNDTALKFETGSVISSPILLDMWLLILRFKINPC